MDLDALINELENWLEAGVEECERTVDANLSHLIDSCNQCISFTQEISSTLKYDGDHTSHLSSDIAQVALGTMSEILSDRVSILSHSGPVLLRHKSTSRKQVLGGSSKQRRVNKRVTTISGGCDSGSSGRSTPVINSTPPPLPPYPVVETCFTHPAASTSSSRAQEEEVSSMKSNHIKRATNGFVTAHPNYKPSRLDYKSNGLDYKSSKFYYKSGRLDYKEQQRVSSLSEDCKPLSETNAETATNYVFNNFNRSSHIYSPPTTSPPSKGDTLCFKQENGLINTINNIHGKSETLSSVEDNMPHNTRYQRKRKASAEKDCFYNRIKRTSKAGTLFAGMDGYGMSDVISLLDKYLVQPLLHQNGFIRDIITNLTHLFHKGSFIGKLHNKILLYGADTMCMVEVVESVCAEIGARLYRLSVEDIVNRSTDDDMRETSNINTLVEKMLEYQSEHGQRIVILLECIEKAMCSSEVREDIIGYLSHTGENGSSSRVIVISTTTSPWLLDEKLISTFHIPLYVPLPNISWRESTISQVFSSEFGVILPHKSVKLFSQLTEGFTLTELYQLVLDTMCEPLKDLKKSASTYLEYRGLSTWLEVSQQEKKLFRNYQTGKVSPRHVETSDILKALWRAQRNTVTRSHVLRLKQFSKAYPF